MKTFACSTFFILCLFGLTDFVSAEQSTTISVSPAIVDLSAESGDSIQAELNIRNGGDLSIPISVVSKSLLNEDEIVPSQNLKKYDASTWITFGSPSFILNQGSNVKLSLYISVPDDASPGGHYAQISVRGLSLESEGGRGASIVIPEVVVTVLISVKGEVATSMYIERSNITPLFTTPTADFTSKFLVVNDGNIHDLVTPVFVVQKDGIELYRQNLESKIILPSTKKKFSQILNFPKSYGRYQTFIEITYENGQKINLSGKENLIVARSQLSVTVIGVVTFAGLYLYNHRSNIVASWNTLVGSSQ